MSITIRVWDLWVRLEKYVNQHLGKRVRRELVRRNEAYADAFLEKFRKRDWSGYPPPSYPYFDRTKECNHLKGGGGRRKVIAGQDYNLAQHTFADGRTKIWCMYKCGLEAWNGDKNFNNLSKLMDKSSNRPSSSERGPQMWVDKTNG